MARAEAKAGVGLRQIIVVTAVALALMTFAVSGALVVLTTSLRDTASLVRETARSTHRTREARVALLVHERVTEPLERARLERQVRRTLHEAFLTPPRSPSVSTAREEAKGDVERYFAATRDDAASGLVRAGALDAALATLEALAGAAVLDTDAAEARAASLDLLGDVIGVAATAVMVGVLVLVVLWTRTAVVRPMLDLSRAMDRFARGDLQARASPGGAAELHRMTEEFNFMAETLARQRAARLTHVAGVVHDLRNPLAALQLSAGLVDPARPLPPEPAIRRALSLVRRQVGRLNRMVDDLLDATRIDSGHLELEISQRDLRDVVREVAGLFEDVSEHHQLQVELSEVPLLVRCDAVRLEQLLSNLVSNAIKYSPRGGVVRLRAYGEGGKGRISVSDQGLGIDASDLAHIWEPFRRTGVSTESIPGVGLGLWTALRIAQAHHGEILVTSTVGEGSTFTLVVPLADTAAARRSSERRATPAPASASASAGSRG
jgi:two-component system, OmpR family, sensor histidine kinase MtrB